MVTWQDSKYRVVSLEVLEGMCAAQSGMCHSYRVAKVTPSRVRVEYSNPNEYGSETPFCIEFPCYRSGPMVCVVLDILRTVYEPRDYHGEGWQAFDVLLTAPAVNPNTQQAA